MSAVVLVLTDVQGSTALWHDEPEAMSSAMARHHEIVHGAVAAHGGWRPVDQGEGDAVFAAFESPVAAVAAVVEVQRALAAEEWATSVPLQVRVGVHVGEVIERGGNLFGDPVNRCARIRGLGAGGQTLLSAPLFELVRDRLPAGVTVRDLGEHRMKDLTRPERVHQVDIDGLTSTFPPLKSLDIARHNLPLQLSSFVGREIDVAAVTDLVGAHRLVTITGFGGMGKTRLALQVAAELADGDGDGVWFIDLSAATDPARVAPSIAAVLGISETGDGPAPAVMRELADKRLLLVLDNLEQILDSATFISELLAAAPNIRVLATSRASLRVRGEHEYALQPLGLAGSESHLDGLGSYAAVRLFIDRAVEARHDFTVTNETAPAVAAICAKLEGHPLSIELAAARIKVLAPDALLARLDTALTVLTGGGRDRPERHQTLRATIAWSYDALAPAEQRLLDALSVFPGTANLVAIEAICGPVIRDEIDVLDGITALVDNSLLRVTEPTAGDPDTRYSLLVSIREHATEHLARAGLTHDIVQRHATYYAALQAPPVDESADQGMSGDLARQRDIHNLRAAFQYCQLDGSVAEESEFVGGFVNHLLNQGQNVEARAACDHLLARSQTPSLGTALAHRILAVLESLAGHREATREHIRRAQADALASGHLNVYAAAATDMIWEVESLTQLNEAIRQADAALGAVAESGNQAFARWNIELMCQFAMYSKARYADPALAMRAVAAMTGLEVTDPHTTEIALATLLMDQGDYPGAADILAPLTDITTDPKVSVYTQCDGTAAIARLRLSVGQTQQALELARTSSNIADELGAPGNQMRARLLIGECLFSYDNHTGAIEATKLAASAVTEDGFRFGIGKAHWRLARIARLIGDQTHVQDDLATAWACLVGQELRALPDVLGCLIERGIHAAAEDPDHAARLIGLVQAHRRSFVLPLGVASEIEPLLDTLRGRLGDAAVDRILVETATRDLPSTA